MRSSAVDAGIEILEADGPGVDGEHARFLPPARGRWLATNRRVGTAACPSGHGPRAAATSRCLPSSGGGFWTAR